MGGIKKTIATLALLASVMALSSLIYGAFHQALGPYMQGIMGGILDAYRAMRDSLFSGIGAACALLINWARHWLSWLPPAPWFTLPNIVKDVFALYLIGLAAFLRWDKRTWNEMLERDPSARRIWFSDFIVALRWPRTLIFFVWRGLIKRELPELGRKNARLLVWQFGQIIIGVVVFFLLAYAEERINL